MSRCSFGPLGFPREHWQAKGVRGQVWEPTAGTIMPLGQPGLPENGGKDAKGAGRVARLPEACVKRGVMGGVGNPGSQAVQCPTSWALPLDFQVRILAPCRTA